ncbi:Thiopurine S-methyltransferase [Zostera marina]|uniref:Thiopurine S-methyltransferase n=1 Tax=Zostera marina TaxID=29655 RepID=A0A0K9PKN7_ZOSMR|nr:Thiopurine S-methyltransferase [Zostera marina]
MKSSEYQKLIELDPTGGWETCWKYGKQKWDLGKETPAVLDLLRKDALPKGRIFVPGCGTGYDVVAMAGPDRYVVGMDISETCVRKSQELFSGSPNVNYFTFLQGDFFKWNPEDKFDLIFDYTFFCAIDPSMRKAWGQKMRDILNPDGELIALMFPLDNFPGGPPFALSVSDYEDVLIPLGFNALCIEDNAMAIPPRMGREKLGRWTKRIP